MATTLKGLASAYANGLITKENYRRERATYLESVLAGEVSLPEPEIDTTTKSGPITDFNIRRLRRTNYNYLYNQTSSRKKSTSTKTGLLIAGSAIVVALLIIILIISVNNNSDEFILDSNFSPDISALNVPPTGAQFMISDFLQKNMWGEGNLDSFSEKWQAVPESERAFAMNSVEYSRLINAIYKKLLEERALSRLGNPRLSYEKQQKLIEFASILGIKDQRISLPEPPPGID
jgi:hypothetical protein